MVNVRFGVIGAGGIALRRTIPEGIVPASNAALAAVYSPRAGREIGRRFGVPAASSVADLLSMDVDAVYIATPTDLHLEQILASAEAGKHVLCEKPLALNAAEASHAVAACARASVRLGVGLHMRFQTQHEEASRLLKQGVLGVAVLGRAQLSCWYPPIRDAWRQDPARSGGGVLADLGCHAIDLLEMYFGPTQRVFCSARRRVHAYPVEDTALVQLEFASGAVGVVDVCFNVPDNASHNRLELYGSQGAILGEQTLGQEPAGRMVLRKGVGIGQYDAQQSRQDAGEVVVTGEPISPYRRQIEAFVRAVLEDRSPPVDGVHGLWNQRLLDACYRSASERRVVDLV